MSDTFAHHNARIHTVTRASSGAPIRFYDDGTGVLWHFYDSMGTTGIVRADTWEEAWEICEDELFPEANEATWEAMAKECDYDGDLEKLIEDDIFQENYGFRPNGRNATDKHGHGIYQKDLNGEGLDRMTDQDAERLGFVVEWIADD